MYSIIQNVVERLQDRENYLRREEYPAGTEKTRPNLAEYDSMMIQCEQCDSWYHYRCIGIKREPKTFICAHTVYTEFTVFDFFYLHMHIALFLSFALKKALT